jgi:hypothetical protein
MTYNYLLFTSVKSKILTLILLTWTIWRAPTNASKWRMGFNSVFKGLKKASVVKTFYRLYMCVRRRELEYTPTYAGLCFVRYSEQFVGWTAEDMVGECKAEGKLSGCTP